MPDLTTNLELKKPLGNETADIDIINENMDIIDAEIAKKASATEDGRMSKEDKIKLDGIEEGATNYQHPATHPASMIEEDSTHRFVTDTEKTNWNAKETPSGAQAKADTAELNSKAYTDIKVASIVESAPETLDTLNELAQALGDDPNFATTIFTQIGNKIDNSKKSDSVTSTSSDTVATSKAVKTAYDKGVEALNKANEYTTSDVLAKIKTVDGSGSGIDADLLDGWHRDSIRTWSNILSKPSTFPPSTHEHVITGSYIGNGTNNRTINIGSTPKFVIITTSKEYTSGYDTAILISENRAFSTTRGDGENMYYDIITNGFRVNVGSAGGERGNVNGIYYYWTAFI